jgi:hypothetical protein
MTKLTPAVLSTVLLGVLAAPAFGQGAPPPNYPPPPPGYTYAPAPGNTYPAVAVTPQPGYQTHDGFYLQLQLGPGYTTMSAEANGSKLTVSGGGIGLSIAAGGAIAPNLILFGQIVGNGAVEPKVESGGLSGTADGSATVSGFGGGITYYVMPANLYLSASLLAAQLSISNQDGREVGESDIGVGINLSTGLEFWVSDNWGLGGAIQFMAARMPDKAPAGVAKPTWTTVGLAFMLSATFN